ncbi:hypothetical protein LY76DRAFT_354307 [Colletotrichum caudatum]|nr:hypothetical protein LY76DRAFT_354307 [Colletotrichum caudatum]
MRLGETMMHWPPRGYVRRSMLCDACYSTVLAARSSSLSSASDEERAPALLLLLLLHGYSDNNLLLRLGHRPPP